MSKCPQVIKQSATSGQRDTSVTRSLSRSNSSKIVRQVRLYAHRFHQLRTQMPHFCCRLRKFCLLSWEHNFTTVFQRLIDARYHATTDNVNRLETRIAISSKQTQFHNGLTHTHWRTTLKSLNVRNRKKIIEIAYKLKPYSPNFIHFRPSSAPRLVQKACVRGKNKPVYTFL